MSLLDTKVLRKKKLDKELNLRVFKNEASERLFVEFSSKDGKMVVQKSFQDTYSGRIEAKVFEDAFKSIEDLKNYLNRSNQ